MFKLKSEDICEFLSDLCSYGRVYAPCLEDGVLSMRPWDGGAVCLEGKTAASPKFLFFPQSETVMDYVCEGAALDITPSGPPEPVVVFGVRPCDLASIRMLDKVFLQGEFVDDMYKARRDAALIVGLACDSPDETCFCNSFGITPGDGHGADIMVYPSCGYIVGGITPKGMSALESMGFLQDLEPNEGFSIIKSFKSRELPLAGLCGSPPSMADRFDDPIWNKVARGCLACGACTYICPTCHCFSIADSARGHRGMRVRCWDSCMFSDFMMMAGGHNPRPTRVERIRQRFMHKLSYCLERYGEVFCVGCGRCISACPIGLSIADIMLEIGGRSCGRTLPGARACNDSGHTA